MEGKSLYEIGQVLYTIDAHKIKSFTVESVAIYIYKDKTTVYYREAKEYGIGELYDEKHCFPTKEMLLKSLD